MSTIKNYNSNLELSNYKLGTTYTFYIHNSNIKNLPTIKETEFEMYTRALTDTIEKNKNIISNNERYLNFTKSIGMIVDTHESTHPNDIDYITVIFKTVSNDFIINKYIADHTSTYI